MLFKRTNRIIFDLKAVAVAAAIPLKNVYKVWNLYEKNIKYVWGPADSISNRLYYSWKNNEKGRDIWIILIIKKKMI